MPVSLSIHFNCQSKYCLLKILTFFDADRNNVFKLWRVVIDVVHLDAKRHRARSRGLPGVARLDFKFVQIFRLSIEDDICLDDSCVRWIDDECIVYVPGDDTVRDATVGTSRVVFVVRDDLRHVRPANVPLPDLRGVPIQGEPRCVVVHVLQIDPDRAIVVQIIIRHGDHHQTEPCLGLVIQFRVGSRTVMRPGQCHNKCFFI